VVPKKFSTIRQSDREYPGTVLLSVISTTHDPQTPQLDGGDAQHGRCEHQQGRDSDEQGKGRLYLYKS